MFPVLLDLRFDTPGSRWGLAAAVLLLAVVVAAVAARETRDAARRGPAALAWGVGILAAGALASRGLLQRGLHVFAYGALIGLGLLAACAVAGWLARRSGQVRPEHAVEAVFVALIGGLSGSRLLDALVDWPRYAARPALLLDPGAGYVFQGGVLLGTLSLVGYARLRGAPPRVLVDLLTPALALAHAFGRLGCLGAGCCWGAPAGPGHAWALRFPGPLAVAYQAQLTDHRLVDAATHQVLAYQPQLDAAGRFAGTWLDPTTGASQIAPPPGALEIAAEAARTGATLPLYPVQLMECLGELALFALLVRLARAGLRPGQSTAVWLVGYSLLRLVTETLRGDEDRGRLLGALPAWYNPSTGTVAALALAGVGLVLWWQARRPPDAAGLSSPAS